MAHQHSKVIIAPINGFTFHSVAIVASYDRQAHRGPIGNLGPIHTRDLSGLINDHSLYEMVRVKELREGMK
jgi:hypothetical protein